jgi:hypothetical protein
MSEPGESTAGNGSGAWMSGGIGGGAAPGAGAPARAEAIGALVAERPEVAVGAAFVGGLIAAVIVRRLGH